MLLPESKIAFRHQFTFGNVHDDLWATYRNIIITKDGTFYEEILNDNDIAHESSTPRMAEVKMLEATSDLTKLILNNEVIIKIWNNNRYIATEDGWEYESYGVSLKGELHVSHDWENTVRGFRSGWHLIDKDAEALAKLPQEAIKILENISDFYSKVMVKKMQPKEVSKTNSLSKGVEEMMEKFQIKEIKPGDIAQQTFPRKSLEL